MKDAVTPDSFLRYKRRLRSVLAGAAALGLAGVLGGAAVGSSGQDGPTSRMLQSQEGSFNGATKPSKEMDLAFADLGRINEVLVKEGDEVDAGQLLISQDMAADQAALQALRAEADVAARVGVARTQLKLAELELEATKDAGTAFSHTERERAALEVEAAQTRILEEQRQGQIASFRADERQAIIDQRSISSPDSGVVQTVDAAVGEVFGPQTPALRLVKIDPLYVEVVDAPASQVMKLRVGDPIQVRYDGEDQWLEARIVYINPVGDPGGRPSRLAFRAELPNPDRRPAGHAVQVRIPEGDPQARRGD